MEDGKIKRMQNLHPPRDLSPEEAREMQRKGQESRRKKKRGRELTRLLLELQEVDEATRQEMLDAGLDPDDIINEAVADWAMLKRAKRGDAQAYEKLMKKAGHMTEHHDVKLAESIKVKFGG